MKILLQDPGLQAKRQELEPLRDALVNWLLQRTTHEDHDAAARVFDSLAVDSQSLVLPAHHDCWPQICSPSAFASADYAQIDFEVLPENTSWRSWHLDMLGFSYWEEVGRNSAYIILVVICVFELSSWSRLCTTETLNRSFQSASVSKACTSQKTGFCHVRLWLRWHWTACLSQLLFSNETGWKLAGTKLWAVLTWSHHNSARCSNLLYCVKFDLLVASCDYFVRA